MSDPVVFQLGSIVVRGSIVSTWVIVLIMILGSWWAGSHLRMRPGRWQVILEAVIIAIRDQIRQIIRRDPDPYLPLIGTLALFLLCVNYAGFIPGVSSPSASINTCAALAVVVFFAVPYFGIRSQGVVNYLKTYLKPNPIMLPFNVIGEVSRTLALAVRLFGNMMSGQLIGAVILGLVPLAVPDLFHLLGMVTSLIQAYIFAVLATVYIGAALREIKSEEGGVS